MISSEVMMRKEIPIGSDEVKAAHHEYAPSGGSMSVLGLREELANLKDDLDALMSHASTLTESELREARDRILTRFSSVKNVARSFASEATRQLAQGRDVTLEFVRNRPFQSVLMAAGAGLLLGVLLRRD
jgi:ElaB/YqjD/DUF883 family membrane-anchored ribosome-binding protein